MKLFFLVIVTCKLAGLLYLRDLFLTFPPISKDKSRLLSLMHFLQKFLSLFHYTFCSFKDSFNANQRDFFIVRDSLSQIIHNTDVLAL